MFLCIMSKNEVSVMKQTLRFRLLSVFDYFIFLASTGAQCALMHTFLILTFSYRDIDILQIYCIN